MEIFKKGTTEHVATCYNPSTFVQTGHQSLDKYNRSKTWCATAETYENILEVHDVQHPNEIGVVPCKHIYVIVSNTTGR